MSVTPLTNTTLEEMADLMRGLDNFVICGHVSPDGDCLGSQLALAHTLKALGKKVVCVLAKDDPISSIFSFLPGIEDVIPACTYTDPVGAFVAVDVSVRDRIGDAAALLDQSEISFTIDHHRNNVRLSTYDYDDPDSPSASMLVWKLDKHLMDTPPFESAQCAYTGIVTDTGGFRFQNTTPEAFQMASELVLRGVDASFIATEVFQNKTEASLRLEMVTLERMQVFCDGQGVVSWVTAEDLMRFSAKKSDTEPLIDSIRSLAGVRVACMLREQEDYIRGSLRAKDDTDVSVLARKYEGGGHKASSGLTLRMPMTDGVALMEKEITALLKGVLEA